MSWSRATRLSLVMCVPFLIPSPGAALDDTTEREKAASEVAMGFLKELGAAMTREMTKGGPTEATRSVPSSPRRSPVGYPWSMAGV